MEKSEKNQETTKHEHQDTEDLYKRYDKAYDNVVEHLTGLVRELSELKHWHSEIKNQVKNEDKE